jgi:hypothetical protein
LLPISDFAQKVISEISNKTDDFGKLPKNNQEIVLE